MKLVKIASQDVDSNPDKYNSYFHTKVEAPHLEIPIEEPQSFIRWLPLISKSQNIPVSSTQTITLQPAEIDLILSASQASLHTKELNRIYAEELSDLASSPSLAALTIPAAGLFLRLDECSSKDGVRGTSPLRSIEEIILHVCTSHRATNAMVRHAEKGRGPMGLIFLPHDARMSMSREFRVFCAPPDGRVTAVSQYRWHKPSVYRDRDSGELDGRMQVVMDEIVRIHGEIMAEAKGGRGGDMDGLLLRQGFTFGRDVCRGRGGGEV